MPKCNQLTPLLFKGLR